MVHPIVLLAGSGCFLAALVLHIVIWRTRRPSREMFWLVVIFLIVPVVPMLLLFRSGSGVIAAIIFHWALSLAYIMTYPPIQAGCPSLKIILAVDKAGEPGLSLKEIEEIFSQDTLFFDRFDDLISDGLIAWKYDTWGISATGRWLTRFFSAYRRLLKLPLGEV